MSSPAISPTGGAVSGWTSSPHGQKRLDNLQLAGRLVSVIDSKLYSGNQLLDSSSRIHWVLVADKRIFVGDSYTEIMTIVASTQHSLALGEMFVKVGNIISISHSPQAPHFGTAEKIKLFTDQIEVLKTQSQPQPFQPPSFSLATVVPIASAGSIAASAASTAAQPSPPASPPPAAATVNSAVAAFMGAPSPVAQLTSPPRSPMSGFESGAGSGAASVSTRTDLANAATNAVAGLQSLDRNGITTPTPTAAGTPAAGNGGAGAGGADNDGDCCKGCSLM